MTYDVALLVVVACLAVAAWAYCDDARGDESWRDWYDRLR